MSEAAQRKSKFWSYTIPAVCLALFAALVFWRIQDRLRVQAQLIPVAAESNQFQVAVAHPTQSPGEQDLTLPGNVQAFAETPIYARTSGYLTKWHVDIGGRVHKGDLLAEIDSPEVDAGLAQARAELATAQANVKLAETTAARYQGLLKSDSVSQQEVDNYSGDFSAKKAMVLSAEANVKRLEDLQSFEHVYAPFDGVITVRNIDIGALINNGSSQQLFRMAQIDTLRVYVSVPESYTSDVVAGIPAQLQIAEFPKTVFSGKVVRSSGAIDPASRTLLTEVQVPNPKGLLLPGAYAQVTFHLHSATKPLLIPSTALIFRSSGAQVAVVDADNTAHLRAVTVGRDFGANLEVISGVNPDDAVIVNPPDSIANGTPVAVQAQPSKDKSPGQPPPAKKD